MIRLVTSDLDGTLLLGGSWELDPAIFERIRRLKAHGIAFAAASGRQYFRLRQMFEPVAEDIYFIAENGAVVFEGDRLLSETRLDPVKARTLMEDILARPDCEVLISGANSCYLLPKSEEYVHLIRDLIGYRTVIVDSLDDIPEPVIKVSAYRKEGASVLYPVFAPQWEATFNMAIAGHEWLDFTLSDKGTGLDEICRAMGIAPADVMSFGDNYNDLPLLQKAGHPYIMENAAEDLRARFEHRCTRVEETLDAFLQDLETKKF